MHGWYCTTEDARPVWFWEARRLMAIRGGIVDRELPILTRPMTWIWSLIDLVRPRYAAPRSTETRR
jgi:hypothetical protein